MKADALCDLKCSSDKAYACPMDVPINIHHAPAYMPMEEYLMDNLDIPTRSDTYKIALKNLYRERKQAHLEMA